MTNPLPGCSLLSIHDPLDMKLPTLALCVVFVTLAFRSQAQEIGNGDISAGAAIWKGDRDVADDPDSPDNKVIAIKVNPRKEIAFYQNVDIHKLTKLVFKFDVKRSDDFKGEGFTVRLTRPNGITSWFNYTLDKPGWQPITADFGVEQNFRTVKFEVGVMKGESGKVYFDNFSVTGN